jgi:hypothetical protein
MRFCNTPKRKAKVNHAVRLCKSVELVGPRLEFAPRFLGINLLEDFDGLSFHVSAFNRRKFGERLVAVGNEAVEEEVCRKMVKR